MLFVFWIFISVRKRCPLFMKKAFVAITSVSLKIKLESRKWQLLPASGAPVLRRADAPELKMAVGCLWVKCSKYRFLALYRSGIHLYNKINRGINRRLRVILWTNQVEIKNYFYNLKNTVEHLYFMPQLAKQMHSLRYISSITCIWVHMIGI